MADDPNQIMMYSPDGQLGYVHADKVNSALDHKFERAIKVHNPKGQEGWVRQTKALKALDAGFYVADQGVLTDPKTWPQEVAKQGRYNMSANGKTIPIPYSFVGSAAKAGYVMSPEDRQTYIRDAAADPNLGAGIVGRNSAGQPIFGEKPVEQPGFFSTTGNVLKQSAESVGKLFDPRLTLEEKERNAKSGPLAYLWDQIAYIPERLAEGQIAEGQQAKEEWQKAGVPLSRMPRTRDEQYHREQAIRHATAAAIPLVGPWVEQAATKTAEMWGEGNYRGAAGNVVGNVIVAEAPRIIGKGVIALRDAPRATAEAVTGTGPQEIRNIAEETAQKNEEAAQKADDANAKAQQEFDNEKIEAEHDTTGREIGRKYDIHQTAQEQAEQYRKEGTEVDAHNARVWEKTSKKYVQDANKVKADNQETLDKYDAEKQRINQENTAAEHLLEMRRTAEENLQRDTTNYYAREDAVGAKARSDANAKWNPVHQSLDPETIDGGDIKKPLDKILDISPEVRREIRQLIPDPEDVDPESAYGKERQRVMQSSGYPKGTNYFDLPEEKRTDIDKMTASSGLTPEPVDLDPQAGVGIPFDKIHRAQSIIGKNIRNGRYGYEGPLLGEMKQLQKILHDAESKIAAAHGKTAELDDARQATREYQEAFGRARNTPKSQADLRKQQANPDQFREENEQERVELAEKFDPSLATEYEKVKAQREALKNMKTEDQLRKSIQQVPQPPTVGDPRSGYSLKPVPVYEPPTIGDLRPGFALKPRPSLPPPSAAVLAVREPERASPGPEPKPVVPETKTISPEDFREREKLNTKATAKMLRSTGLRRALYATLTGLPFAVIEFFTRAGATGAGEAAVGGLAAGGVVLAGSHMMANLLEKPGVANWIAKLTPHDAAAFDKLPPEQKALFTEDMKQLLQAAKAKGMEVSPAWSIFIAGTGAPQKPTLDDLKKQVQKAKPQLPTPQPTVAAPAPGPQSSVTPAGVTHLYDDRTGRITPV